MQMGASVMTCRERIYATLRGKEVDRFPVWLKMANRTWQSRPSRNLTAAWTRSACCARLAAT